MIEVQGFGIHHFDTLFFYPNQNIIFFTIHIDYHYHLFVIMFKLPLTYSCILEYL